MALSGGQVSERNGSGDERQRSKQSQSSPAMAGPVLKHLRTICSNFLNTIFFSEHIFLTIGKNVEIVEVLGKFEHQKVSAFLERSDLCGARSAAAP